MTVFDALIVLAVILVVAVLIATIAIAAPGPLPRPSRRPSMAPFVPTNGGKHRQYEALASDARSSVPLPQASSAPLDVWCPLMPWPSLSEPSYGVFEPRSEPAASCADYEPSPAPGCDP